MCAHRVGIGFLLTVLLATTGKVWGCAKTEPMIPAAQTPSEFENDRRVQHQLDREERALRDLREASRALETLTHRFAKRFDAVPKAMRPQLSKQDLEDLKQVEKLAKRVRDLQGARGEGEDATPLPSDFSEQVALLAHLGAEVRQQSERVSRHTVSVGILSRTTRILRLLRAIRTA
jgi:hypothetical protein